jgi:methyl-accepting chemotaxis protein
MMNLAHALGLVNKENANDETSTSLLKLQALDNLSANVMIADHNYNIMYMNDAIIKFLRHLESDIKKELPSFSVDRLIGSNIDIFHKNPSHQRNMLDRMTSEIKTSITVGGHVFNLAAIPLTNGAGKRTGVAVEWQDSKQMDSAAQIFAINRSMAVIEFTLDGVITGANENFLNALGYRLDEILGQHHSMFVEPEYGKSIEYRNFWDNLRRGSAQTSEFKRLGKGGKEIYIQASYNPIVDLNNKVFKVVKYASDITEQVLSRQKNERVKNIIIENISEIETAITNANQQSENASASSVETSSTVQSIAAGAEEMNSSVEEIAESMAVSKVSVDEAYDQTITADNATQQLTAAAQSMGGIVELIQAIASQINLLALNATIESARAGDAGKGFAVVANEVKNLAMQTTTATEQIAKEIDNMQSISENVVKSLSVIKDSIENVRKNVTGVASAVSEQSAVTQEMSSNMQSASAAVTHISNNVGEIARSTERAKSSAQRIIDAVTRD